MSASMHRYSCDRLGLCAAREPACADCNHLERSGQDPAPTSPEDAYTLLLVVLAVVLLIVIFGVVTGYVWAQHGDAIAVHFWSGMLALTMLLP